jgi:anti-sigma factor RsiW
MTLQWPWRRRRDLTCEQAVALVTAYLDGALSGRERDRLDRHLALCPHCREHFKQIEATILVTGEIRTEDLQPPVREDLMDLYRRWRDESDAR